MEDLYACAKLVYIVNHVTRRYLHILDISMSKNSCDTAHVCSTMATVVYI